MLGIGGHNIDNILGSIGDIGVHNGKTGGKNALKKKLTANGIRETVFRRYLEI